MTDIEQLKKQRDELYERAKEISQNDESLIELIKDMNAINLKIRALEHVDD